MHILVVKLEMFSNIIQSTIDTEHALQYCSSFEQMFDNLAEGQYQCVFINTKDSPLSPMELLESLTANYPSLHIIFVGQKQTSETLIPLLKAHLTDYIAEDVFEPEFICCFNKLNTLHSKLQAPKIQSQNTPVLQQASNNLIQQSPVGIATLDRDKNISSWNMAAKEATGLSESDVINGSFFSFFETQSQESTGYILSRMHPKTLNVNHFKAFFSEVETGFIVALINIDDRVQKETESEHLINQMVILNDLSRTITSALNLGEFLETLTQQLLWIYSPSAVRIYLYDEEEDIYFLAGFKQPDSATYEPIEILTTENSPLKDILETGIPMCYHSQDKHEQFEDAREFETLIYYPVQNKGHIVSILSMVSETTHFFDDAVLSAFELLCDIIGISLQNVLLYEDINEKNEELNSLLGDIQDAKEAIEQQAGYLSQLLEETEQSRRLIEKQNELKERELNKAAELQENLLPDKMFESDICAFESIYIPCNEVAGDIYDVIKFDDGRIGIIIADVSDHGVSSAMIAAMFKMVFSIYCKQLDSPKEIFEKINEVMNETINTGDYVTAFYGILTPETKEFRYASAGHPAAIVCDAFGENIRLLNTDGFFIGMFDFSDYEEKSVILNSGDHVLMYTDGIYEIKNKSEEEYSKERLQENFVNTIKDMNMFPLATLLVTAEEYAEGIPYDDDLTLLHTIIK